VVLVVESPREERQLCNYKKNKPPDTKQLPHENGNDPQSAESHERKPWNARESREKRESWPRRANIVDQKTNLSLVATGSSLIGGLSPYPFQKVI